MNFLAGLEDEPASSQAKSEGMLRKGLAAMTFVELLFWKNVHDSEQVREEYHWKVRNASPITSPMPAEVILACQLRAAACHPGARILASTTHTASFG